MRKQKFVIVSPKGKSGGVIVLHTLCKCLADLGYDARMFYILDSEYREKKKYWIRYIKYRYAGMLGLLFPHFRYAYDLDSKSYEEIPIKNIRTKSIPWVSADTVVVYPEIVYGNPLNSKKCVRWFLYYNRFAKEEYSKNDLFICYREIFNDWELNPEGRRIYLSYFDTELYKRTNFGSRNGKCYIIRKGRGRKDLPTNFEGPIIDNFTEEEKVAIFNSCEYCISYDTQTAYSLIASLCGCISVVIPEEGKSRADYDISEDFSGSEYVAFGMDKNEIECATSAMGKVNEWFEKVNDESRYQAELLVNYCNDHFVTS